MKERYWVFGGVSIPGATVPKGGFRDFLIAFDGKAYAHAYAQAYGNNPYAWAHIVDMQHKTIIEEFEGLQD